MAASINEVLLIFTGNSASAMAAMGEVQGGLAKTQESGNGLLGTMSKVGAGIAVAAIGVAAVSIKMATTFQQDMTLIRTQANDTTDNIATLGQQFLTMAGQVGQTPDELAKGFYHIASAGYTGAAAIDILRNSAELAAVGQSNLEDTTNAVIGVLKSGVPGITGAADAVAQLNAIVGGGNMRMSDFVSSLGTGLASTAATFGVSMQSIGAALDYMTDRGVPAVKASTQLGMALSLMAAPTKAAAKILETAGLSAQDAADQTSAMQRALELAGVKQVKFSQDLKQPDGMVVALTDLKKRMTDAGVSAGEQADVISRAFGGGRTGKGLMMLWNNLGGVQQKFNQLGTAAGNFGSDWAQQQATASQQFKDLMASLDAMLVTLGTALLPIFQKIVTAITPIVNAIAQWIEKNPQLASGILIAVGAFGLLLAVLAPIAMAVSAIGLPVLGVIAAIAVLAAGVIFLWTQWDHFNGILKAAIIVLALVFAPITAFIAIPFAIAKNWGTLVSFFTNFWKNLPQLFSEGIALVVSFFQSLPGDILSELESLPDQFGHLLGMSLDFFVKFPFQVIDALVHLVDLLLSWAAALVPPVLGAIGFLLGKALFLFLTWPYQVIAVLIRFGPTIVGTFFSILGTIASTLLRWGPVIIGDFFSIFGSVVHAVVDELGKLPSQLFTIGGDIISGLWHGLTSAIGTVFSAIGSFVHGILHGFLSGFGISSPSTVMMNIGINIIQGLLNGLKQIWTTVTGWAGGIKDQFVGFFAGAANWLVSAGVNLIQGLIQGIGSMAGAAGNAVTNLVKNIPGVSGVAGGVSGLLSHLPHLASGSGWLNTPQLAVIGDNPRGERVQTMDQYEAEQQGGGGGHTYNVTVNHPTSSVDVAHAIQQTQYLQQMSRRGIQPQQWPVGARA